VTTVFLKATLPENLHHLRLDQALAKLFPEHSRSRLQNWIAAGKVLVDSEMLRAKDKVCSGQQITINATVEKETLWEAQALDLTILYEDQAIIVVNKPAGLVVHPAVGNRNNTLVNALLHYEPKLAHLPRAGIVHRLDKDTSGVMVVARTLAAHTYLVNQIQARAVTREYLAVVNGQLTAGGSINVPIGRHPTHRTKMAVVPTGKNAVTHYRILERFAAHTLIKVVLETGRTHQIRVHMAYLGYPLTGDPTYGRLKLPANCSQILQQTLSGFKRQALHAYRLSLLHPETKELIHWEAELPADMEGLIRGLREEGVKP
jgi:23S rRNA pseudouridine1911/1915/1917 synthase